MSPFGSIIIDDQYKSSASYGNRNAKAQRLSVFTGMKQKKKKSKISITSDPNKALQFEKDPVHHPSFIVIVNLDYFEGLFSVVDDGQQETILKMSTKRVSCKINGCQLSLKLSDYGVLRIGLPTLKIIIMNTEVKHR